MDALYAVLLAVSLCGLAYVFRITVAAVWVVMGVASLAATMPFGQGLARRHAVDWAAFGENWHFGRWALLGVLVTHIQTYSHVYLLGALAGSVAVADASAARLLMMPVALAKLLVSYKPVQRLIDRLLNWIAMSWIGVNNASIGAVGNEGWQVGGTEGLRRDDWYLVAANHQSWVDILVLQNVFSGRVPMLKFFLKRQLIYVPVIGLAWWALDFPFMQRKGGMSSAQDLERARLACEKFRLVPTAVINFLEGTRFTRAKHDLQRSPYRHLLKPRSGDTPTIAPTPPISHLLAFVYDGLARRNPEKQLQGCSTKL